MRLLRRDNVECGAAHQPEAVDRAERGPRRRHPFALQHPGQSVAGVHVSVDLVYRVQTGRVQIPGIDSARRRHTNSCKMSPINLQAKRFDHYTRTRPHYCCCVGFGLLATVRACETPNRKIAMRFARLMNYDPTTTRCTVDLNSQSLIRSCMCGFKKTHTPEHVDCTIVYFAVCSVCRMISAWSVNRRTAAC